MSRHLWLPYWDARLKQYVDEEVQEMQQGYNSLSHREQHQEEWFTY